MLVNDSFKGLERHEVQFIKLYVGDDDGIPAGVGGERRSARRQIECDAMNSQDLGKTAAVVFGEGLSYLQHRRDAFPTNLTLMECGSPPLDQITWDFNSWMRIFI